MNEQLVLAREELANLLKLLRNGACGLEFSHINEECLVISVHQTEVNASLLFVHTARRFYR